MSQSPTILFELFIIFLAAQIGAEISGRFKSPAVVGEILAGVLIGPFALGLIHFSDTFNALGQLGIALLLFSVGLATPLKEIRIVGSSASLAGILGVLTPFVLGMFWAKLQGYSGSNAAFIACAFIATSAGITSRVLNELGVIVYRVSRIIIGAAIIDDILAMLLLGIVTSLHGNSFSIVRITVILVQSILFILSVSYFGKIFFKRRSDVLESPLNPRSPFAISLVICLGLAAAANALGLAAIIGAFLAGTILSETGYTVSLQKQSDTLCAFLTPFFFVFVGAQVKLDAFKDYKLILLTITAIIIGIAGKMLGGYFGAYKEGKRSAIIVAVGLIPRGEISLIVATLGLRLGIISSSLYSVLVTMSLMTYLLTPILLRKLFLKIRLQSS